MQGAHKDTHRQTHALHPAICSSKYSNYIRTQNRTLRKWTGMDGAMYLVTAHKVLPIVQI